MIKKIGGAMLHTCEYCGSSSYYVKEERQHNIGAEVVFIVIGAVVTLIGMVISDVLEEVGTATFYIGLVVAIIAVIILFAKLRFPETVLRVVCLECGDVFTVRFGRLNQRDYLEYRKKEVERQMQLEKIHGCSTNESTSSNINRSSEENV